MGNGDAFEQWGVDLERAKKSLDELNVLLDSHAKACAEVDRLLQANERAFWVFDNDPNLTVAERQEIEEKLQRNQAEARKILAACKRQRVDIQAKRDDVAVHTAAAQVSRRRYEGHGMDA